MAIMFFDLTYFDKMTRRAPYKNQFRSHFDITWYSVIELNWIGNIITYFERLTHFFAFLVFISTLICMSLWGFTNNLTLFVVGLKIYVNWWGGIQHPPLISLNKAIFGPKNHETILSHVRGALLVCLGSMKTP